jgi:hypothetical protein
MGQMIAAHLWAFASIVRNAWSRAFARYAGGLLKLAGNGMRGGELTNVPLRGLAQPVNIARVVFFRL